MRRRERNSVYAEVKGSLERDISILTKIKEDFDKKYGGDMPRRIEYEYEMVYETMASLEDVCLDLEVDAEEEDD